MIRRYVTLAIGIHILAALTAIVSIGGGYAHADLILNEALANEPGGATSAEWVEVLNWPDSGNVSMAINGYQFIDGNDTTVIDAEHFIPPGGFLIFARRVVGDNSFESHWGDNSGVWGDVDAESYPVIEATMRLRNSTDTVALISSTGETSTMFWSSSSNDNVSIERIRPNGLDHPDNFAFCKDPTGSTPGRENSVLPVRDDLGISSLRSDPADLFWKEPVFLSVTVVNVGFGDVNDFTVDLLRDVNPNAPRTVLDHLHTWDVSLVEGDSLVLEYTWNTAPPGRSSLLAQITSDGNVSNNETDLSVAVRFTEPLIIVSEFLANPSVGGPGEWMEIANRAGFAISLAGVEIGDSRGAAIIPLAGMISPSSFWVLAENETEFRAFYPNFSGVVFQIPGWRELNNSGDVIRLIGSAGEIIDSVSYGDTYADNRSVERLELTTTFAGPDDWTGSVDHTGATPGRPNSVNRERAGQLTMSASPNPLSLASGATMVIDYRLDVGESLSMKIYDRSGHLVRTLFDNLPAATGLFAWDGTDDNGDSVDPGAYILWARSNPSGREQKMMIVIAP